MKRRTFITITSTVTLSFLLLAVLNSVWAVAPAPAQSVQRTTLAGSSWSSGWVDIAPGETKVFAHALGGDPALYAVRLWFKDSRPRGLGIHERGFGGMEIGGKYHGVYWRSLTDNSITVVRMQDDETASQVYLRIWIPDPPEYDSGWQNIASNQSITLAPNLTGDLDDYTVGMKFRSTSSQNDPGIHIWAFGGMDINHLKKGAAWHHLTNNSIQVLRFPHDVDAEQVRLFIHHPDQPSYDSGWQSVARGQTYTFTNNLGGNVNDYVVRVSQQSAAVGQSSRAAGGMEVSGQYYGINWQNLTNQHHPGAPICG